LQDRDDWWQEFALEFDAAEREAQAILDKQAKRKRKR
jgi:hypothetical protein